jgi:hypothetical protein
LVAKNLREDYQCGVESRKVDFSAPARGSGPNAAKRTVGFLEVGRNLAKAVFSI